MKDVDGTSQAQVFGHKVASWINRSKGVRRGTDFVQRSRWARNTIRSVQGINLATNIYQTGGSGVRAYHNWRESCSGGVPWVDLLQTGLSGLGVVGSASNFRRSFQGVGISNNVATSTRVINSFDEFQARYHQAFEGIPGKELTAWEWYQKSATSDRISVIGRLDDIAEVAPAQTFHRLNVNPSKD